MNLPNKLTIARVIMIPLFLICLYLNIGCGKYIAVGIFILASLTDLSLIHIYVYQEVLLRYLKYRPHFENCEHEKNWFVAVTINACKSFKTSAWQRHNVTVDDDSWSQILADNTESREISQDDTVMDALMQLDDDTRLIMQMYY